MYGCTGIKGQTLRRLDEKSALYLAPEFLNEQLSEVGSKEGDIYSFGIICATILTMKPAYGLDEESPVDEIHGKV
jgi:serine/threonine protein kinase